MSAATLPFRAMPRPPHHPLLGHIPEWLGVSAAHGVLDTLQRYADDCGPLVRIPFGPIRMVLVADPELAGEFLTTESANIKGWNYTLTRVVLDNVLLLNGEPWAAHRKAYRGALKHVDLMEAAQVPLERWMKRVSAHPATEALMLDQELSALCANICTRFIASADFPVSLEPYRERVQYELAAVGIDLQCQPWAYFSPARWTALREAVETMREFFTMCVRARDPQDRSQPDILTGFRELQAAGEIDGEEALRDGLVNFFFTAHDVLTASVMWCLYTLAEHPEIQRRLREALSSEASPAYLGQVVRESLRLYPGYPLFSRRTSRPITLGGYTIPARTDVIVSPRIIHRMESLWPDPERFDPDRWEGQTDKTPGPRPSGGYMPFGGGFRSCIAFRLAFPLIEQVVARVIRGVHLSALPGHDPKPSYWGSTFPAAGMPVEVKPVAARN